MWRYLVEHAKDYGFLGPIVGIVGLLLGASGAIELKRSLAIACAKLDRHRAEQTKNVAME
jgi:hypothetical protein